MEGRYHEGAAEKPALTIGGPVNNVETRKRHVEPIPPPTHTDADGYNGLRGGRGSSKAELVSMIKKRIDLREIDVSNQENLQ